MLIKILKKKGDLLYIFFTAITFCVIINELNVHYIKSKNSLNNELNTKSMVHSGTIWSIDNAWYLPQIKHILNREGYTLDPKEPEMRVRRTPIYPLFYGCLYYLFGEQKTHNLIPYLQSFLFAISSVLITLTVFNVFGDKKWAKITGYTYALLPFIPSYCYFTLTESISPFLVVSSVFCFSLYLKKKTLKSLILCGIVTGVCFLNRATSGVIIVGFLLQIVFSGGIKNFSIEKAKRISILCLSFFISLAPWIIRNYFVTNEIIVSEKFYHGSPMDFGKGHIELRNLTSCWTNPANLSTEEFSNKLRINILNKEEYKNTEVIQNYLNQWPDNAFLGYSREELKQALFSLNECFINKNKFRNDNPNSLRKHYLNLECEEKVYFQIKKLKERFIEFAPLKYYIFTPLKTIKELTFNSFIHNVAILNPDDKQLNMLQFSVKSLAFILNVLCFISPIYFILFSKFGMDRKVLIISPILILLFALTVLLFRYVESRYILVVYPFLIMTVSFMFIDIITRLNRRHNTVNIVLKNP